MLRRKRHCIDRRYYSSFSSQTRFVGLCSELWETSPNKFDLILFLPLFSAADGGTEFLGRSCRAEPCRPPAAVFIAVGTDPVCKNLTRAV